MGHTQLDKTDLKILNLLQQDGRMSNLQLSNEIGLSPAPTLERVKKLEKMEIIIGYCAELDREKLGLGVHTFMQVSLQRHKNNAIRNFIEQINKIDEVVECYHITGGSDYLLRIFAKDIAAYERVVMDKLSKIEGVGQMQTQVVLSTLKSMSVLPLAY